MKYSSNLSKEEETRLAVEKVTRAMARIRMDVVTVFDNENLPKFLNFMARLHHLDAYNLLLVYKQRPTATFVASFPLWQKIGMSHWRDASRPVFLSSQKRMGIGVLAPYLLKKTIMEHSGSPSDSMRPRSASYYDYHIVYLFDKAQTNGIPAPVIDWALSRNAFDAEAAFHAMKEVAPFDIVFTLDANFKGNYLFEDADARSGRKRTLALNAKYRDNYFQLCNFIVRPLVSDYLEQIKDQYSKDELEKLIECVAFVVSSYFGLSTEDYMFFFASSWTSNSDKMLNILNMIRSGAHSLIEMIEAEMIEHKALFGQPDITYADDDILEFENLFTF